MPLHTKKPRKNRRYYRELSRYNDCNDYNDKSVAK